jgi:hypothetical protein
MKTRWELEEEEKRDRERRIISVLLIIAFMIVAIISMIMATTTVSEGVSPDDAYALEQAQEPMIRAVSHKAQIDPVYTAYMERLEEQAENPEVPEWDWSDTPQLDMDDDNFELLVECAFAEAGNQSEQGIRLVVDAIGNRAGWDMAEVDDVITAPYQFSSYPSGMAKWRSHITESFIQICADEWMTEKKADGGVGVWFFRTGHYSQYGTPWAKVGDHYFSIK